METIFNENISGFQFHDLPDPSNRFRLVRTDDEKRKQNREYATTVKHKNKLVNRSIFFYNHLNNKLANFTL